MAIKQISINSRNTPKTKITRLLTSRKASLPPGKLTSRFVMRILPPRASNTREKKEDPNKIINTTAETTAVEWAASWINFALNLPFKAASPQAPTAPTQPASVGVARPKKMLPNTAKMRNKGGTTAFSTRRARVIPVI